VVVEKNAQKTDRFLTTTLYRFSKISSEIPKAGISGCGFKICKKPSDFT
jgi:hypothetical protein